ncbi:MAG: hypothetical protein Q8O67_32865 [Deltaproteobacteria bacterium]|nr:hypothetical protein [Deltaproteobacteria bacterium]
MVDVDTEQPASARQGWRADVCETLERLDKEIEDLCVRGTSACGPEDLKLLATAKDSLEGAGAAHVAARLDDVIQRIRAGDRKAATAVLQLQSSLRVFERVLTIEAMHELLAMPKSKNDEDDDDDDAVVAAAPKTVAPLPGNERKALVPVLEDTANAVQDLVATGLVAASASTKERLDVSFKEASRLKLGRLAASLRYTAEEIQRYLDDKNFSARRLALFANRAWVIGRGLREAILKSDDAAMTRLLWAPSPVPVAALHVVTLGMRKRIPQGTGIVAFDFHLRLVQPAGDLPAGARLVWSHIVPRKSGSVAADAFLHLDVKPQNFRPLLFTEARVIAMENVMVAVDGAGGGRVLLTPQSKVKSTDAFTEWDRFRSWDRPRTLARLAAHQPSPLDLEVELADEVVLHDAEIGDPVPRADSDVDILPLRSAGLGFDLPVARTEEGVELRAALAAMKKKASSSSSPLFGVLHFDMCRMVFTPLSALDEKGPRHLMLSTTKVDLKELTRSLF